MENKSTLKAFVGAIWKGLKTPLLCALFMTTAAILLLNLQDKKTAFDATYQLVSDPKYTPSNDVRAMPIQKFVGAVLSRVAPNGEHLPGGVDAFSIVKKSAEEASNQNFKTPTELSMKLIEAITKLKNQKLRESEDAFEKTLIAELDCEPLSDRAVKLLVEKAKDDKIDVVNILKEKTESPLTLALRNQNQLTGRKDLPLTEAQASVEKFYVDKRKGLETERRELSKKIERIENSYQSLVTAVNGELHDQIHGSTAQQSGQADGERTGFLSASGARPNPAFALILDDKRGLVGVYWLLRVALSGIVLFAFLYLILIPLKHLFFWTASGEFLTEQARKLLESRASVVGAAGPTAAKAVMVTIAAASVAGGAALAANGLPFIGPSDKMPPAAFAPGRDGRSERGDNSGHGDKTSGGGVSPLEKGIADLSTKVGNLEIAVGRLLPPTTTTITNNYTDTDLANSVKELINTGFGTPGQGDPTTLFSSLGRLQREQGELKTAFNGRLDTLDGLIGKKEDQPTLTTPASSLFGKLNHVVDTLGTRDLSTKDLDPTVIESLRKLGTSSSTDNATLFGRINATEESLKRVVDVTADTRRDQLGSRGRNFFTQWKTLSKSERYRVSQSALDEIVRPPWGPNELLSNKLKKLVEGGGEYSEDGLRVALGPLSPGVWDKWKERILRYTRVARY